MTKQKNIIERIEKLEARNKRVESDKAWETSWTRRISVMLLTYTVVAIYLKVVIHIDPWINALVPVMGFGLSTLTLSILKQEWLNKKELKNLSKRKMKHKKLGAKVYK